MLNGIELYMAHIQSSPRIVSRNCISSLQSTRSCCRSLHLRFFGFHVHRLRHFFFQFQIASVFPSHAEPTTIRLSPSPSSTLPESSFRSKFLSIYHLLAP